MLNALSNQEELSSINEISKILSVKNIFSFINDLIRKEIIQIKEDLYDKYKEKQIRVVKFISFPKNIKLTKARCFYFRF